MEFQKTIAKPVEFKGEGIISGKEIKVVLEPAEANKGIIFIREDIKTQIPLHIFNVKALEGCTALVNKDGCIYYIEHLLSALHGLQIDNLVVRVWGEELPMFDGSSKVWVAKLQEIGYEYEYIPKRKIKITKDFKYTNGKGKIYFKPASKLKIYAEINFEHPLIGNQIYSVEVTPSEYIKKICFARTFGFKKDIEEKIRKGFFKGGNLKNAVVLDENGILNKEGLRVKDEFVRHKILDIIGDMYVLGAPLIGEIISYCSSHRLHIEALKKMYMTHILKEYEADALKFLVLSSKKTRAY